MLKLDIEMFCINILNLDSRYHNIFWANQLNWKTLIAGNLREKYFFSFIYVPISNLLKVLNNVTKNGT